MTIAQRNWSAQRLKSDPDPGSRPDAMQGSRPLAVMGHFTSARGCAIPDGGAGGMGPVYAAHLWAAGVSAWLAVRGIDLPSALADAWVTGSGDGWLGEVRIDTLFCRRIPAVFQRA